jgi:hypothetical protein
MGNVEGSPSDVVSGDFDGDGDDDLGVFSVGGVWTGFRSDGNLFTEEAWGRFGGYPWTDRLVGDFDGDGDDDIISFHPPSRRWWISKLQGSTLVSSVYTTYGTANGWSIHLAADVDGDGSDELTSFHPSNGTWWATNAGGSPRLIYDVSTNSGWQHLTTVDHDGDGVDELAMFHPSNGTWWVVDGSTTPARLSLWAQFTTRFGWVHPMSVDYDSDGREDLVIRHQPTGRSWALIGGGGGRLSYLGTLVAGETEGEWIGSIGSNPALIAYTRS